MPGSCVKNMCIIAFHAFSFMCFSQPGMHKAYSECEIPKTYSPDYDSVNNQEYFSAIKGSEIEIQLVGDL